MTAARRYTTSEIESLLSRFFSRTMNRAEWTHEAHLILAIHTCWNHPREEAEIIRKAILAFNESVGVANTDDGGYHETITLFWIAVAKNFLEAQNFNSVTDACNAFIADPMYVSGYPEKFYNRDLLFSVEARRNWIAPPGAAAPDFDLVSEKS